MPAIRLNGFKHGLDTRVRQLAMSTWHWSLLRGFEAGAVEVAPPSGMGSFQRKCVEYKERNGFVFKIFSDRRLYAAGLETLRRAGLAAQNRTLALRPEMAPSYRSVWLTPHSPV